MRAISRYSARMTPGTMLILTSSYLKGDLLEGPEIQEFEKDFAMYQEIPYAISASYGRMAFYYILKAMEIPEGSEIIFPALTFWVVPAMAKAAGLKPVFIDIKPDTYNMDPAKIEAAITEKTRIIVPTHVYGHPCEMDEIMEIADRHDLIVIEDCAHAMGSTYKGRKVGTFGKAAFTSFQSLKSINCFGGSMAMTSDPNIASKVREQSYAQPFPQKFPLFKKIFMDYIETKLLGPKAFFFSGFPILYLHSLTGDYNRVTIKTWEKIRPLYPTPKGYCKKFTNIQAKFGIRGLEMLDHYNDLVRSNANEYDNALKDIPSIMLPRIIPGAVSNYYQYCIRVSDAYTLSQRAIRRGIDLCNLHIDVCPTLELFSEEYAHCPNAESMKNTLQLPAYSDLKERDLRWIIREVKQLSRDLPPIDKSRYSTE